MSDDDRRAARAIARILLGAGDRPLPPDPEILAAEIVTALRGHGWRPTPGHTPPDPAEPITPQKLEQIIGELRERLAQTEGTHAATKGGTNGP